MSNKEFPIQDDSGSDIRHNYIVDEDITDQVLQSLNRLSYRLELLAIRVERLEQGRIVNAVSKRIK